MTRINTNVPSMIAHANLVRNQGDLDVSLRRLSTGLRINRGADDPAGLIISERIRSDIRGAEQGIKNAERASSVIATTESALSEVNELLNSIRSLVVEAANTGAFSEEELAANQLQIDSAIDSITRISNTATFGGLKLLNGSLDYNLSGISTSAISNARVHGASFINAASLEVEVDVLASAQTGRIFLQGDTTVPGTVQSTMSIRVQGARGVTELTFISSTSLSSIADAVNKLTSITGVRAQLINGDATSGMMFISEDYGSDSFVSVERINKPQPPIVDTWSTFKWADAAQLDIGSPFNWSSTNLEAAFRDTGRDVSALVNGLLATGDGLNIKVNTPALSLELLLHEDFATMPTATNNTFYITGGGALFQLGGEINANQQSNIGVQSVAASLLGGTLSNGQLNFLSSLKTGETNSLKSSKGRGDFSAASDVLEKSIDEVSLLRGRLGAFERNILEPNIRSLQTSVENLTSSESRIRDADFAMETSRLTRAQILTSSTTSALALANQGAQQVLQLLG